jgi:hypothetical protein
MGYTPSRSRDEDYEVTQFSRGLGASRRGALRASAGNCMWRKEWQDRTLKLAYKAAFDPQAQRDDKARIGALC